MNKVNFSIMLIFTVICLCSCSNQNNFNPEERIIMINDKLYYGTEETGPMGDSGCVDGEIISSVEKDEIPTENGQSNFGALGNPYTKDYGNGEVMVNINDQWFWFCSQN